MATLRDLELQIVRDVANAELTLTYKIDWSPFDVLTNLQYTETWRVFGDDTGEDVDDQGAGDDSINLGPTVVGLVSANGQTTSTRTKTKTIAMSLLNEDTASPATTGDEEIRALVTLTPLLPAATSRESPKVELVA
jgi:hypothetical protein